MNRQIINTSGGSSGSNSSSGSGDAGKQGPVTVGR